jgi:hypothetical protein
MSRTRNTIRRKGLLSRFFEKAHGRKRQDCYGLYEVARAFAFPNQPIGYSESGSTSYVRCGTLGLQRLQIA